MIEASELELADDGERETAEDFAGLGLRGWEHFMRMHGDDAMEASIDFFNQEADSFEGAVQSGRKRPGQGRLDRIKELRGFETGVRLGLEERYGSLEARLLAPVIAKQTARKQIEAAADGIPIEDPELIEMHLRASAK